MEINILLHYHCIPNPHPQADAPAVREATRMFVNDGILRLNLGSERIYILTMRGEKLVEMLCSTPYPEERWVDPRFDDTDKK
jgi:hypothetical protein